MKNRFFKSILFLGMSIIFMGSCKKKIDDAYLTPNAPFAPPVESILPGVIGGFTFFSASAGSGFGVVTDGTFIGRYIQYFSSTGSGDSYGQMGYIPPSGVDNTGAVWGTFYFGQGGNVNQIIELGSAQEKWDYVGVAWAIRAWGLLELTNEYSDGPLKEAFNKNLTQFHYDSQPEFYDSCRVVCHRSLSFLNRTDGNVSKANLAIGDAFFYNGDVNKWKKFVYGILARSFIDISSKDIFKANNYAYADSAIKYAGLAMTTNDDNATVKVAGGFTSPLNNYWGPFRGNIGVFRQGSYIADLMSGNNTSFKSVVDPRRWYMLSENLNGTFKGFLPYIGSSGFSAKDYPKNFWRNSSPTSTSPPSVDTSRYLYQDLSPWPMMTASEMQFIIAEAGVRKGDPASRDIALAAYKNAIRLNFDMLTATYNQNIPAGKDLNVLANSSDVFLSNPTVVPSSSANLTLTQVMLQKYIALYIWGCQQTWVDMRKFHYVDLDPATSKQVYTDFAPPSGINLVTTNNGKLVYRFRPRFNSEFLYDVPELTRIGAYQNSDYGTYEMWFSMK